MVQGVTQKPDLPHSLESQTLQVPHPAAPVSHDRPSAAPSQEEMARMIQQVAEDLRNASPQLQMVVDSDLGRVIVKVIDSQSGQVVRQIPTQEFVNLAKQLKSLNGLLLEKQG